MSELNLNSEEILKIFNEINFGIEIETCFTILENEAFKTVGSTSDITLRHLYDCVSQKIPEYKDKVVFLPDNRYRNYDYTKWAFSIDSSIKCYHNLNYTCESRSDLNSLGLTCSDLYFFPTEISTPILTGMEGLRELAIFWEGFLMGYEFVYMVNKTQGLHVNVSHPNMDVKKFISLWHSIENFIIQTLPQYRRIQLPHFATPLKDTSNPYTESTTKKFMAVSAKKNRYGTFTRLEIRVGENSMNYTEVMGWTIFCMHMLVLSILGLEKIPSEYMGRTIKKFVDYLVDNSLQKIIVNKYNRNKAEYRNEHKHNYSDIDLYSEILLKRFSEETILKIQKIQNTPCIYTEVKFDNKIQEALENQDVNKVMYYVKRDSSNIIEVLKYMSQNPNIELVGEMVDFLASQGADFEEEFMHFFILYVQIASMEQIMDKIDLVTPKILKNNYGHLILTGNIDFINYMLNNGIIDDTAGLINSAAINNKDLINIFYEKSSTTTSNKYSYILSGYLQGNLLDEAKNILNTPDMKFNLSILLKTKFSHMSSLEFFLSIFSLTPIQYCNLLSNIANTRSAFFTIEVLNKYRKKCPGILKRILMEVYDKNLPALVEYCLEKEPHNVHFLEKDVENMDPETQDIVLEYLDVQEENNEEEEEIEENEEFLQAQEYRLSNQPYTPSQTMRLYNPQK